MLAFFCGLPIFGALKKFIHICLIGLFLISSTALQELAKLPVLFQHFFEHQGIDGKITFITYLEHHYGNIPHTDNDADRDNQLPFKANTLVCASVGFALPPSLGATVKKPVLFIRTQKIKVNNDLIPSSAFAGKIWQPPKSLILS